MLLTVGTLITSSCFCSTYIFQISTYIHTTRVERSTRTKVFTLQTLQELKPAKPQPQLQKQHVTTTPSMDTAGSRSTILRMESK